MSKVKGTDSGAAWKHWKALGVLGFVAAVTATVTLLVASVTYNALGSKPRRETAWITAAAGGLLGLALWRVKVPYGEAWGLIWEAIWLDRVIDWTSALVAIAAWQVAAGVVLGALGWRFLLGWREAHALKGPARLEQRIDLEATTATGRLHRRQKWEHTPAGPWWQRPVSEPLRWAAKGATMTPGMLSTIPEPRPATRLDSAFSFFKPEHLKPKNGFAFGLVTAGDMFPLGSMAVLGYRSHLIVLGRTRHGKSETLFRQAQHSLHQGMSVILLNCKEPASRATGPSARLGAYAEAIGWSHRELAPREGHQYDPMRGTVDQIRTRLLSLMVYTETYYEDACTVLTNLALTLAEESGAALESVPGLIWSLANGEWKRLAEDSRNPLAARLGEALGDDLTKGVVMRYAAQAVRLGAWIAPTSAGGWGFGDADVIGVDLPTSTEDDAAVALLRCMLKDLEQWITDLSRRDMSKPVRLIVDEISALDDDPVIMRRLLNLLERAAGAGVHVTISAQGPSALGDDRTSEALITNAAMVSFQQKDQKAVERVAFLAGTKKGVEASSQTDGIGLTGTGSARLQDQMNLAFNTMRKLRPGECVLIDDGTWCRVAAGMTADGYGETPALPALAQVSEPDWTVQQVPAGGSPAAGREFVMGQVVSDDQEPQHRPSMRKE